MTKEQRGGESQDGPRHADYDRNLGFARREAAIRATNEKFGVTVGNATLNEYTSEQASYFAQQLYSDPTIVRAKITAERNLDNGFNEFYIEAWVK